MGYDEANELFIRRGTRDQYLSQYLSAPAAAHILKVVGALGSRECATKLGHASVDVPPRGSGFRFRYHERDGVLDALESSSTVRD
ncbi:hypothetical protein AXA44_28115 [Rhodococcus sp. SC4]|nr:hypothetical protein AXA44_28115 [Rhodococcus sp. SC4]